MELQILDMPLKSMTIDKDPKQDEDHGGQGLRRLTQGEWSQVSKWKVRYVAFQLPPMRGKVAKIHDPQKTCRYFQTSQKNCDFLIQPQWGPERPLPRGFPPPPHPPM